MHKSLLALFLLFLLVECKQPQNNSDSVMNGLANPITLGLDSTIIELSDYFSEDIKIDSIRCTGIDYIVRGKQLVLTAQNITRNPLVNMAIHSNKNIYSIPLKANVAKFMKLSVQFEEDYKEVKVKGEFNNWNADADILNRTSKNDWFARIALKPGSYQYKLVADGKEVNHEGMETISNGMGGFNNLVTIPGINKAQKPVLYTDTLSEDVIHLLSKNVSGVLAYWNNNLIDVVQTQDSISIAIPKEAKTSDRSFIRVYGFNNKAVSNDLLIPLNQGEVITDAKQLNSNDWHKSAMYFMMIDRFKDGNSSNNLPVDDKAILAKAQYYGGDVKGITQKIEDGYFQDLGITTIWISPITQNPLDAWGQFKNPDTKFSGYHGYWPVTSTTVDFRLGSPQEVKEMLSVAHDNGLNVLLDYVANHVHQQHSVYQNHPDWVTPLYLEDGTLNTELWDEQRLTTWFDTFLPTLNLMDQQVTDYMVDSALYWIEEYDFDGFRHDATKHIPENFWRTLTKKVKAMGKDKGKYYYQIGETYGGHDLINRYINPGMLDAQFDFNMYDNALAVFADEDASFGRLTESLQTSLNTYGHHHLMGNITGNQDKPRFISYADGSLSFETPWQEYKRIGWTQEIQVQDTNAYKKLALFNLYNMMIPGIPIVYYGDEIGMPGAGDPDNRRMMRFDSLNKYEAQLKSEIASFLKARQENMALIYGTTEILHESDLLLVIRRKYFDNEVVVMINRGQNETTVSKKRKGKTLFTLRAPGNGYAISTN